MAATPSTMMPLGTIAPAFSLPDTISGNTLSLGQLRGDKATLIMFVCNHCPYVLHVIDELVRIAREYQPQGVGFAAISSNDVENYPQDGPELMKEQAMKVGYTFPYLYDESQGGCQSLSGRLHARPISLRPSTKMCLSRPA
jgi:thiol-disulfide isomerase/thioredoxin